MVNNFRMQQFGSKNNYYYKINSTENSAEETYCIRLEDEGKWLLLKYFNKDLVPLCRFASEHECYEAMIKDFDRSAK